MNFSSTTVLCVGDLMLDRFIYGEMERISPEAPVPVLRLSRTREMLGGAGNVANNVASLGGRAILVGLVGRDQPGERVARLLEGLPGIDARCVETDDRPTICKTRFIAVNQQVVRTDEESLQPMTTRERAALLARVLASVRAADAVVLADYGKAVLDSEVVAAVIAAARADGTPVFVDPKSTDFSVYRGATCITPNTKELALAAGEKQLPGMDEVVRAARRVLADADADAILATRSEKGMVLVERSGAVHSVRARAREVFDVSGAGDTVIAALALSHAAGRPLPQAMHIANAAASVVVSKFGTATAAIAEVLHELDAQDHARMSDAAPGAQSLERVRDLVGHWRDQGFAVGFTNGCFDILHPGHVALLAFARSQCDRLIVALNTDASVTRLKGTDRPVNTLDGRARVIAALRHVDCVVAFDEDTPRETIEALRPDVLVKGEDYAIAEVVGADIVEAAGGRVILARLVPGHSTTGTIARLRAAGDVAS